MKKTILIAEDNADIRKLVRYTLEQERFQLNETDNGAAALALARSLAPDVMILDVMMPGELDGYAVCRQIKQDPVLKDIRVVLLTARGQRVDIEAGQRAGADAYLVKPFSPLKLIETVEQLAGLR